jgi:hypothetical protein
VPSSFWIPPASPRRSRPLQLRRRHRDRHLHAGAARAFLRLEGINTAQGNAKVLVELYRVAFDPLKEISFISDEYNKFELEGSLLADTTKPYDAVLGQFGRIVQL